MSVDNNIENIFMPQTKSTTTVIKRKVGARFTPKTITALKAIAEPNRLYILSLLRDGELCVCEIEDALSVSQNLISHHLKVLRQTGLVRSRRDGVKIMYSFSSQCALSFFTSIVELDNCECSSNTNSGA